MCASRDLYCSTALAVIMVAKEPTAALVAVQAPNCFGTWKMLEPGLAIVSNRHTYVDGKESLARSMLHGSSADFALLVLGTLTEQRGALWLHVHVPGFELARSRQFRLGLAKVRV